jgi:hypothetical protein
VSTAESRAHDADVDARTACPDCRALGIGSSVADCPGHPADTLPDPETLDLTGAIRYGRIVRQAAATMREDGPRYGFSEASASWAAGLLEDWAEECDTRRERIVERMGGGS